MRYFTGKQLRKHSQNLIGDISRKRFIYQDLMDYTNATQSRKVCCLYGLRRTGKTIMANQLIVDLNAYETTLYVFCDQGDSLEDLYKLLDDHQDKQYIIIDEATRLEYFIDACSSLADTYLYDCPNRKIILAGTDSLGFVLARRDALYDRVSFIHTTYIPYAEYHYLLEKDIDEYIEYGGTLTDGRTVYNEDSIDEYVNSAITQNILHSLENWDQGRNFGILTDIYDRNELESFINRTIEFNNHRFVARVINRRFKSHDLGSLKQLMVKHRVDAVEPLESERLRVDIMNALHIVDEHTIPADQKAIDEVVEYLKILDLVYKIPESQEVIFTQPGMRYCQATAIIQTLRNAPEMKSYSREVKDWILRTLDEDIKGSMLEDIVFLDLSLSFRDQNHISMSKYDDNIEERTRSWL